MRIIYPESQVKTTTIVRKYLRLLLQVIIHFMGVRNMKVLVRNCMLFHNILNLIGVQLKSRN